MIRSSKIVILEFFPWVRIPSEQKLCSSIFAGFGDQLSSPFRDPHFYSFEPLCDKGVALLPSYPARMREMKDTNTYQ